MVRVMKDIHLLAEFIHTSIEPEKSPAAKAFPENWIAWELTGLIVCLKVKLSWFNAKLIAGIIQDQLHRCLDIFKVFAIASFFPFNNYISQVLYNRFDGHAIPPVRRSAFYPVDNKTPRYTYRGVGIISCAIQPPHRLDGRPRSVLLTPAGAVLLS